MPTYALHILIFSAGALSGGIFLALLLRRAVRNELNGKSPQRPKKPT